MCNLDPLVLQWTDVLSDSESLSVYKSVQKVNYQNVPGFHILQKKNLLAVPEFLSSPIT